jgi:L-2-hydroxyglutarate oxidase LhgO
MTGEDRQARCPLAILGAGVLGCALAQRVGRPGVLVLDQAARAGTGISSRNSGVVHAGLYYPPGSRKALTCVEGNARVWEWVASHGVAHRRCGKLVVARGERDEQALDALVVNAAASGALLERVTLAQARALEPSLPASVSAAAWSPRSGIVDVHGLVRSLQVAAESKGVAFVFGAGVTAITPVVGGFELVSARGSIVAERVINAAGLGAVALARMLGVERELYLARGDYFRLRGSCPWTRLIYPVVRPGSPALGVHLTLELDGRCRLGPDLDWVEDADDFGPARGELKHAMFHAAAERLLGPIDPSRLVYDGCGIRPKLVGPGEPAADFEILEQPAGCWHLLGIESPGLTATLALAEVVAGGMMRSPG